MTAADRKAEGIQLRRELAAEAAVEENPTLFYLLEAKYRLLTRIYRLDAESDANRVPIQALADALQIVDDTIDLARRREFRTNVDDHEKW